MRRKPLSGKKPSREFVKKFFPKLRNVPEFEARKVLENDFKQDKACESIKLVKVLLHQRKRKEGLQALRFGLKLGLEAENHAFEKVLDRFLQKKISTESMRKAYDTPGKKTGFFMEYFEQKDPLAWEAFGELFHSSYQRLGYRINESRGFYTPSRLKWLAKYNPEKFARLLDKKPELAEKLKNHAGYEG